MDQVGAGVTVFFLETSEELGAEGMASADEVYAVRASCAEGAVHAGTEAYGSFGHANDQHRSREIRRDFSSQALEAGGHDRWAHWYMAAQHFGYEEECPFGIPALCKTEQVRGREDGVVDFDLKKPPLELGA
ncbi:hypothetical protein Z046_32430 [Pseudomonas aeruginosa VRFPA09]|nr:hypothetical protein M770_31185 [Pseudomonas aeruginosa VRFPA03]EVT82540.1 hypothetical protein Z046_32430 [Pseudomonas aeruginosa VRFPA09]WOE62148.1 hypothetical protein PA12_pgene424 [Pseudomonas aeruginosa]